jgi:hypothetical protein
LLINSNEDNGTNNPNQDSDEDDDELQSERSESKYLRLNLQEAFQRIAALEEKVSTLSLKMHNMTKNNVGKQQKSSVEITEFIKSKIGSVVRDNMFSSIKYLDDDMVQNQGELIFNKIIAEAHINKDETNAQTFIEIIRQAKKFLNVHKCHVRKKLRLAAVGKHGPIFKCACQFVVGLIPKSFFLFPIVRC